MLTSFCRALWYLLQCVLVTNQKSYKIKIFPRFLLQFSLHPEYVGACPSYPHFVAIIVNKIIASLGQGTASHWLLFELSELVTL